MDAGILGMGWGYYAWYPGYWGPHVASTVDQLRVRLFGVGYAGGYRTAAVSTTMRTTTQYHYVRNTYVQNVTVNTSAPRVSFMVALAALSRRRRAQTVWRATKARRIDGGPATA
jgi:hypothetical protein